jgi:hypothetical protein
MTRVQEVLLTDAEYRGLAAAVALLEVHAEDEPGTHGDSLRAAERALVKAAAWRK